MYLPACPQELVANGQCAKTLRYPFNKIPCQTPALVYPVFLFMTSLTLTPSH